MATIRYVHPTNGPYYDIPAAVSAAQTGDTILIWGPYTYSIPSQITVTKAIHFKGETNDPINSQVKLDSGGSYYDILVFNLSSTPSIDLWIEGLTFTGTKNSSSAVYIQRTSKWEAGRMFRINRCQFQNTSCSALTLDVDNPSVVRHARFENCTFKQNGDELGYVKPTHCTVDIIRCQLASPLSIHNGDMSAVLTADYVTVSTTDYGCGYGVWYSGQWMGTAISIFGQVILPDGIDRSTCDIRMYSETNGVIDATYWVKTKPHPVTGEWAYPYLPNNRIFWVQTVPPSGYQPRIDGPYAAQ